MPVRNVVERIKGNESDADSDVNIQVGMRGEIDENLDGQ